MALSVTRAFSVGYRYTTHCQSLILSVYKTKLNIGNLIIILVFTVHRLLSTMGLDWFVYPHLCELTVKT